MGAGGSSRRPWVVLIGPPGSGKTAVARALARLALRGWRDTDTDVERAAGKPVADIFVDDGEPAFRDLERQAVTAALGGFGGILALGGGAVMTPAVQEALADYRAAGGTVVFLDVSLASAAPRVGFNRSRPLLLGNPRAQWKTLMDARRPTYERLATFRVDTDAVGPADVARQILARLGEPGEPREPGQPGKPGEPSQPGEPGR